MAANPDRHEVLLTWGAEQDLEAIYTYIAAHDGKAAAKAILDQVVQAAETLAQFPARGSYPRELVAVGIREYRQITFKPYRMIYRPSGRKVVIFLVADGRRDMQSVLARRLLGA